MSGGTFRAAPLPPVVPTMRPMRSAAGATQATETSMTVARGEDGIGASIWAKTSLLPAAICTCSGRVHRYLTHRR